MGKLVNVIYKDRPGRTFAIPEEAVADEIAFRGARLETPDDAAAQIVEAKKEADYGGVAGTAAAIHLGTLRGITAGLSDVPYGSEATRELRDRNAIASTGAEVIGAIGGAKIPFAPARLASKAGGALARTASGASALSKIGRAGAGAAVEGGIYGIGTGVSELALSGDPVTLERATSVISSNALFGGLVGGAAGTIGKSAEIGLQKAKAGLDRIRAGVVSHGADDLAGKTAGELETLHEAEVTRLAQEQSVAKASAVDDIATYRKAVREANPYLVVSDEGAAKLSGADRALRKALDSPKALAKNPARLGAHLENQETALLKAIEQRDDLLVALEKQNAKIGQEVIGKLGELPADALEVELTGSAMKQYGRFADVKIKKGTASIRVSRDAATSFVTAIENGAVKNSAQRSLEKLDGLLDANRALQQKLESTTIAKSDLLSDRLTSIKAARAELQAASTKQPGIIEQVAQGSIFGHVAGALSGVPILGPLVGARVARAATDLVFGRLGKATAEMALRTSKAIDGFLSVTQKAAPYAPVLATKVLSRVAYAPQTRADGDKKSLASLYKARSAEIRSQTAYGPDGKAAMRPEARQAMSAQLAGVKARDPLIADQMETIAARRLEFLANKLPRRPDIGGIQLGPDNWQPSELEMRAFARYAAAVEDPAAIVERLASGTITPEDAEAMRTVFPETFAEIKARIIERLPELHKTLPYNRRVALSIFSGVPVDPAMRPEILAVLQGQFEEEPGSDGGMQAPQAAPQFGSITKENPTPGQQRAG